MSAIPDGDDLVQVYRPNDEYDLVATPITVHGLTLRPEKNGPGTAQFSITLDDPAYENIRINDVAAIRRDGTTIAAMIVEMRSERTLDADGGARQTCTFSGRLVGAFLEWCLIYPALGDRAKPIEDDCILDWRSPRYDPADDPWEPATELMTVADASDLFAGVGSGLWPTQPMAEDFTASTGAYMLWDSSGSGASNVAAGACLFYRDIEITVAGRYVAEVLTDNEGTMWDQAVQVLEVNPNDGYQRVSFKRLELTAGTHRFCWLVNNIAVVPGSPAALAWNLFKADQQDRPLPGGDVWISDSNTQVLSYPDPFPGMTVGDGLVQFLAEGDSRPDAGVIWWCVPSFTKDEDSNGDPWDRESITTKTGMTNLLMFMDELVAAGRISRWRWRPDGITLDVFRPDYSSRPTFTGYPDGLELEPAPVDDPRTGQIIELNRTVT